jgi:hypothetical protein
MSAFESCSNLQYQPTSVSFSTDPDTKFCAISGRLDFKTHWDFRDSIQVGAGTFALRARKNSPLPNEWTKPAF